MKRQKDMTPQDKLPWSEDVQYASGEEWKAITNNSRKNEVAGPKSKRRPLVDVPGGESKVGCCKEKYHIQNWNVRSRIKVNWL